MAAGSRAAFSLESRRPPVEALVKVLPLALILLATGCGKEETLPDAVIRPSSPRSASPRRSYRRWWTSRSGGTSETRSSSGSRCSRPAARRSTPLPTGPRWRREWERLDSLSWRFHLRPGARWQDGKPVTSEDVRFSFEAFSDSVLGSGAQADLAGKVEVIPEDSATFLVRFATPRPSSSTTRPTTCASSRSMCGSGCPGPPGRRTPAPRASSAAARFG